MKRSYRASEPLIHSLPTFPATLATPQSAAAIAECDRTSEDERMRSLIHSLPTFPATLATSQSVAVTAGCDHAWQDEEVRSLIHCLPTSPATLATPRWIPDSDKTDWGIAIAKRCCEAQIGRFYSFAPHQCAWMWCYLIWLDKLSPSSPWTVADIAWENDLEPLEEAA